MDNMKNFLKFKTRDSTCEMRKFSEEYYIRESTIWKPFRLFGVFSTTTAMICLVASVADSVWIEGLGYQASIWDTCYWNSSDVRSTTSCLRSKSHWQNAVIGFLMFSTVFGFIGTVLAGFGLFTTALPKKIYYYHSSGEIFSICAVSIVIAVIIYPIAIALDETIQTYHLSLGYGLAWSSAFFFLASALCMSLDDIIRGVTNSKLCKTCFKKEEEDNRQRV